MLPEIVDSLGVVGEATALPEPLRSAVCSVISRRPSSARDALRPNEAKVTFGTGAMLDCVTAPARSSDAGATTGPFPSSPGAKRADRSGDSRRRCSRPGRASNGSSGLGLVSTPAESEALALSVPDAGGVFFVPRIERHGRTVVGLGARGAFVGLSASTTRAEVVRAVLEGIAHTGADLLEAIEADANLHVDMLHVDGGMTANRIFVELSPTRRNEWSFRRRVKEATMLGAAFAAGTACGVWPSLESTPELIRTEAAVEPRAPPRPPALVRRTRAGVEDGPRSLSDQFLRPLDCESERFVERRIARQQRVEAHEVTRHREADDG